MYLIIKYIHITCIVPTIILFVVRGISKSYKSMGLQYRWYILLGNIALKREKTKMIRGIAGIGALITFFYLVMVTINHRVIP